MGVQRSVTGFKYGTYGHIAVKDFDDYIELCQECITLARSIESSAIDKTIANSAKVGRMKLD